MMVGAVQSGAAPASTGDERPVVAVLQARVSSSRLPGKVLKPLAGRPMLERHLERLFRARTLDRIVVATSDQASDEPIAALCERLGVACFRGSLNDVLERLVEAARPYAPAHLVRLTGDCPLADPQVIDQVVELHRASGADYTCNVYPPTFPDGLDVEAMRWAVIEAAAREAVEPYQREHATQFILKHPERFRIENLARDVDLSGMRWTVDEPEDYEVAAAIYAALYEAKPDFATADILAWLAANPAWATHNLKHERNAALAKSVRESLARAAATATTSSHKESRS